MEAVGETPAAGAALMALVNLAAGVVPAVCFAILGVAVVGFVSTGVDTIGPVSAETVGRDFVDLRLFRIAMINPSCQAMPSGLPH